MELKSKNIKYFRAEDVFQLCLERTGKDIKTDFFKNYFENSEEYLTEVLIPYTVEDFTAYDEWERNLFIILHFYGNVACGEICILNSGI